MTYDDSYEKMRAMQTVEIADLLEKCLIIHNDCDGCPFVWDEICPKQMDILKVASRRLRFLAQIESLWTLYKDDQYANLPNFYRDVRMLIQKGDYK